jgi:FkbM family methyltransferase
MDGLRFDSTACRYVASRLGGSQFTVIDVGCSGGIDAIWRLFGSGLRAFCFDPNLEECRRLNAAETLPGVEYVPAFVGLPHDDPVIQRRGTRACTQRNPWNRLAVAATIARRAARQPDRTNRELTAENQWHRTELADPTTPLVLSEFLRDRAVADIDVLKIDVDGPDFDILQDLSQMLDECRVLAVGLEVNFYGSHEETDHTFHNTDRFMRAHGFDLFNLTVQPYSMAALPARYKLTFPAQSEFGRPLQGDALYLRDLGDPDRRDETLGTYSPEKLAKLSAIHACFGLYDCAAETLLTYREQLSDLLDVDHALELLCAEVQRGSRSRLTYAEYMAAFDRDEPTFYLGGDALRRASVAR